MIRDLPPAGRLPLLIMGMLALVFGVLSGLARLGVTTPQAALPLVGLHSALLIAAFFGTVISLERAVAIARTWAYLAPLCAGFGGLTLIFGQPLWLAQAFFLSAATLLTLASVLIVRRQFAIFTVMLAVASACWLLGVLAWHFAGIQAATAWWLAFLVLTIAGERLELTRLLPRRPIAMPLFMGTSIAVLASAAWSVVEPDMGLRAFGGALLALGAWLVVFDIARFNIRQQGLTRFIAVCLLTGYAWLAIAGAMGLIGALSPGHPLRDGAMHAVTLGFVFSMVFGHAPIIFPAVMRVRIPYHPFLYVPLALLHGTLALRMLGGLSGEFQLSRIGATAGGLVLALFVVTMLVSVWRGREKAPQGRRRRHKHAGGQRDPEA
ncbi:MAG TPA: hypothetical protein PLN31_05980 [Azoarcus taiwanensis]|nr:hypothetical protein [Azoarcus taiwanensis]